MRPTPSLLTLPAREYTWVGYDGSTVVGIRPTGWYNTPKGKVATFLFVIKNLPYGLALTKSRPSDLTVTLSKKPTLWKEF